MHTNLLRPSQRTPGVSGGSSCPHADLPVRPDLDHLKNQAKDLLKSFREGDREASAHFAELHPDKPSARRAKLADAQLVLARLYGASSWTRIVQCCQLIDAIWDDDADTVRRLVTANRNLLIEDARIVNSNWGPPMSYAANLGRDRIIRLLYDLGARDLGAGDGSCRAAEPDRDRGDVE